MAETSDNTLIIVAVIAAVPGAIAAIVAIASLWQNRKNAVTIQKMEVSIDGKMAEYVDAVRKQAGAEGQLRERDAERAHLSEMPPIPLGTPDDPVNVKPVTAPEKKKGNGF